MVDITVLSGWPEARWIVTKCHHKDIVDEAEESSEGLSCQRKAPQKRQDFSSVSRVHGVWLWKRTDREGTFCQTGEHEPVCSAGTSVNELKGLAATRMPAWLMQISVGENWA